LEEVDFTQWIDRYNSIRFKHFLFISHILNLSRNNLTGIQGNFQDLTVYEEGIRGNIDREVDEWTSVNQL
jgi:hypothetical protein